MNDSISISSALQVIAENLVTGITVFIPRIFTALVIFLLGWIVARIIQIALEKTFSRIKFDGALERVGITDSLARIGLREKLSILVPKFIYFLIVVFVLRVAAEAAGLTEIADTINTALGYVPNVFTAFLIVILGSTISQFVERAVTGAARSAGIEYAGVLGKLVASVILFIVLVLAIAQLRIDMEILNSVVLIVFAAAGLCIAFSLGLGTRDITRNLVAGFYARRSFKVGDDIEIDGVRGVIEAFTPLAIVMNRDHRQVAVPNSALLSGASKHQV